MNVKVSFSHLFHQRKELIRVSHATNRYILSPPQGTPEFKKLVESGGPKARDVLGGVMPFAYAMEQGTKPSTVGMVMGCSPMSLLSWYVHSPYMCMIHRKWKLMIGMERNCYWYLTPSLIWILSWLSPHFGGSPIHTPLQFIHTDRLVLLSVWFSRSLFLFFQLSLVLPVSLYPLRAQSVAQIGWQTVHGR